MTKQLIRKQILLLAIIPIVLIGIMLYAYFMSSQLNALDDLLMSRGLTVAEQLASASEYGVVTGNAPLLSSLTESLIKEEDVIGILITDARGKTVLSSGKTPPEQQTTPLTLTRPKLCTSSANNKFFCSPIVRTKLVVSDFESEEESDSVDDTGEIIGTVYIGLSTNILQQRREQAIFRSVLITFSILFITGLIARHIAYNIARPIEQLTDTVDKVEHGNLDILVNTSSKGEIGSLQHGVNRMIAALKQHHDHLEDLINERTVELIKQREHAEQANIAKSKFLATASHDLRQPLHALRLFVDILVRRVQDTEVRSIIDDINRSTNALEELFNNLLDLSRVEANVITPDIINFPLQYLFDRLRTDYATTAYRKGLWFRIVNTKAIIQSDFSMLERILRNLISNAIRYTDKGGILIGCRRRNGKLVIEVLDTGIGIPASEMQSIFSEFHQLNNPERDRRKGLGLGLAIAEGLAQLLHQKIKVASTLGKGTCFSISVPFGKDSPVKMHDYEPASKTINLDDKTIVLIDDEKPVRDAMEHILADYGCNSIIGEDVDDALQQLEDGHFTPDLIIADYRLRHGVTGINAIERLRDIFGDHIPAMVVTGDTSPEWLQEAESTQCLVLFKPVKAEKLYSDIAKLLNL
jgi:signal transduction histidine kinase